MKNPLIPALAISLVLNMALIGVLVFQANQAGEAKAEKRDAVADAKACSDGVSQRKTASAERDAKHAPNIAAAAEQAAKLKRRAAEIQVQPLNAYGDVCTNAQAEVDAWHKEQQDGR